MLNRTTASAYPWKVFWLLLAAGIFGIAAIIPYAFSLLRTFVGAHHPLPIPLPVIVVLQCVQGVVVLALAVGLGLLFARKIGLGAPILESWLYQGKAAPPRDAWRTPILVGAALGALIALVAHFIFLPRLPQLGAILGSTIPLWKRFLASFYGGIDEEIFMRLFLLSVAFWGFGKIFRGQDRRPSSAAFWIANTLVALLFGLGHLPATRLIMPITPLVVVAALLLNGIGGLGFGYLYWKRGLEAAMLAHFSADLVLHVIRPL